MVARYAQRFVVSSMSDLNSAREAIGSCRERVILEATPDSPVLVRMEEYRELASTVSASDAEVSFMSEDPLRVELARIAGLTVVATEPVASGVRRAIDSSAATRKIDAVEAATPRIPDARTQTIETPNITDEESWASFSFVVNPPVPRRPGVQQNTWYYESSAIPVAKRRPHQHHKASRAAGIAAAIVAILLLVSSGLMAAVVVPRATVTLTPVVAPVETQVTVGVAGFASAADVLVDPVGVNGQLTYQATIPTTGIRTEPDGFATGELALMNPLTVELVLPAGTVLSTAGGQEFATSWDVSVPPADPFGTGAMGAATVHLQATLAGPDSNIPAFALEGQFDNGLFFMNREVFAGGTVKEIATVAEADLETLRSDAISSLEGQAASEVAGLVPAGFAMIEGTLETGDLQASFSHEIGKDATEVSINATLPIAAQAYDPAALEHAAQQELGERIVSAVPAGSEMVADSSAMTELVPAQSGAGDLVFEMSANAMTRAIIDPAMIDALRRDLIGATEEQAAARVVLLGNVAGFQIEHGPDWLPFNWPPRLESRIAIIIDDSTTTTETPGTSGP